LLAKAYTGSNPVLPIFFFQTGLLEGKSLKGLKTPKMTKTKSKPLEVSTAKSERNNFGKPGPCSLAVEHPLGKGEVTSSILVKGSIYPRLNFCSGIQLESHDPEYTVSLGQDS
jgi:hypothetical protein